MLKKRLHKELTQWLPAYAGGHVRGWRRLILRSWLARDASAGKQLGQIEAMRREIRRQPREQPEAEVFLKIQAAIAEEVQPARRPTRPVVVWTAAVVIALATLLLVWQALPPGISLEWSVEGQLPAAFRVYRAPVAPDSPAPSQPFTLLDELQANEAAAAYQFTDWLPLPGQNYVYRVEALDQSGQPTASQTIVGRGVDALPALLSAIVILVTTLLVAYLFYTKYRPVAPHPSVLHS